MKDIKGIIFDYGGTLDTGGDHWSHVIWDAYQKCGVAVSNGEFREAYVYAERELARTRHILPEHDFHDLLLIKMSLELQWLSENGLFPPAQVQQMAEKVAAECYATAASFIAKSKIVLRKLASKYPMVLVSNFYGNIESVLKDFGMEHLFQKIIESAVVGVRKPDPKIFSLGVEALGLQPEEVVVVGDSLKKDILPAESIGCKTVWIKGKGWTDDEDNTIHNPTITELSQLLSLLNL